MNYKYTKFNKPLLLLSIGCVVVFILIIVFINISMDDELYAVKLQDLQSLNEHVQSEVSDTLNKSKSDLSILAAHLAKEQLTRENAINTLREQSHAQVFDDLYYINLNGRGSSINNMEADFSQNPAFLSAVENEFTITSPHISAFTNNRVIDLAVPIIQEGEIMGVLLCENSMENIYQSMNELTTQGGSILLLDNTGTVFFSTDAEYIGVHSLRETAVEFPNIAFSSNESANNMKTNIANRHEGSTRYEIDGIPKIALYAPVEDTPWTLLLVMNEAETNTSLDRAVNAIILTSITVVILLLLFILYSWYTRTSSIKTIEKIAYYDPLTELPNLAKLKMTMSEALCKNKTDPYTIVKCDVENFKAINDLFSYEVGNAVLKTFKPISEMPDEKTLIVARVGTDEFLFFAGNHFLDNLENNVSMYESTCKESVPELADYELTFKYGRYFIPPGETDVDSIIAKVGLAHSMSKSQKGQPIFDYDENYKQQILEKANITNRMRSALINKEFKLYLQPKTRISDEEVIGAEALVRWVDANGNITFPDKFIPLFEKNGFIVELDKYMVDITCATLRQWINTGWQALPVSVNCSRVNLANPHFVEELAIIVDTYAIPHEYIEIELTESTMIENEDALEQLFSDLHEYGFRVSIDDFGSGFSSLGLLKNLKVDTLKLDRSFFVNNKDAVRGELVIDGIIKLSQSLNMHVVAEGIEEAEQTDFLRLIGCDAAQGYYYAKPMPAADFKERYARKPSVHLPLSSSKNPLPSVQQKNSTKIVDMALCILNAIKTPVVIFNDSFSVHQGNTKTLELFDISDPDAWSNAFFSLSPPTQPDGQDSNAAAIAYIEEAKKSGYVKFNWIHLNKNHEEIPCEIIINKILLLDDNGEGLYIGLLRDMRSQLADYQQNNKTISDGFFFNKITDKTLFNIITTLSYEWFYCFDIIDGTIQFFGTGSEKMNLPKGKQIFPDPTIAKAIIHTDDIDTFYTFVQSMRDGVEKTYDIRLIQPNGEPCYYRFIYKSIRNDANTPLFSVGKAYDISDHKELEQQAQIDLLTRCYNKISTENLIKNILATHSESPHALFVVDIDDFKAINDNLGHVFGDTVLCDISTNLHMHFRDGDIIGRIGGDEFIVFLKNINNMRVLNEKASAITSTFKNTYIGEKQDYKVSGSVGIALYPHDGTQYEDLFNAADKALYQSKLKGKDCYTFYSNNLADGTMKNLTLLENVGRIADAYFDADFISNAFEMLYEMRSKDTSLELLLEYIGKHMQVDRCYIFESKDEGKHYTEIFEWCNTGIPSQKNHYQNTPKEDIGEFIDNLDESGIFYCNDFSTMKSTNAAIAVQLADLQSILLLHTKEKEQNYTRLFIGFDDCTAKRVWTEKEINSARYILKMISIFILFS